MIRLSSILLSLAGALFCGLPLAAQQAAPAPETFALPLPGGVKMEFILLPVTNAENPFSSVSFQLGKDLQASYDKRMALSSVAGTIYVPERGGRKAYWAIPMCRTEVTRAQYAAVMTPDQMPAADEAQLPCTNVSYADIQAFIAKLNEWCLGDPKGEAAQALKQLAPSRMHGAPFLRLPQENEWEFAARGGGFVSPEQLKEDIPYEDRDVLQQCENVYLDGNERLRPVGYKETMHPGGFCDMLGNARELVDGVFRPEYHFGRAGGLIIRGGCYMDQDVSSYTRSEVAPFNTRGEPYRNASVGFRLAIGSCIVASGLRGQRLEDVWDEYVEKLVQVATPGSTPTDSLEKALEQERHNLALQLQDMAKQMAAFTGASGDISDISKLETMLTGMSNQLREMEKKMRQSQATSAQAALQMIYFASAEAAKNIAATNLERRRSEISGITDETRNVFLANIKILEDNVPVYWAIFSKGCTALKDVDPAVVDEQVRDRMQEIDALSIASEEKREQVMIFKLAIKHFRKYVSTGRLSLAECKEWYHELESL